MLDPLLIVGASCRAAAQSALRDGFAPLAADLFADEDLAACGPTERVTDYPLGLLSAASGLGAADWMYTGALENYPGLVTAISARRRLLGNTAEALRGVRDPFRLAAVLRAAGFPFPETVADDGFHSDFVGWLCKSRRSSGGVGVTSLDGAAGRRHVASRHQFLQRFVAGQPGSAIFLAAAGRSVLLGATHQLLGSADCGERAFRYHGSIGPISSDGPLDRQLTRIGDVLAREFALAGLFGVDFVLADETAWTIEVNPRYTASVEILERTSDLRSIAAHVAACRDERLPQRLPSVNGRCAGKKILFARQPLTVDDAFAHYVRRLNQSRPWPAIADIPRSGATIEAGHPIATVFADGSDLEEVSVGLDRAAEAALDALGQSV